MEFEKIKIFLMTKKHLALIDLHKNKRPFHRNQLLHVIQGFLALILQLLYLVFEANTVREYMNSIIITTAGKRLN